MGFVLTNDQHCTLWRTSLCPAGMRSECSSRNFSAAIVESYKEQSQWTGLLAYCEQKHSLKVMSTPSDSSDSDDHRPAVAVVVLAAVTQDGDALEFASATLQQDKAVVLAAVTQRGYALRFASETLQFRPTLQLISACDLAHEATKLRLALATCLLYRQPVSSAARVSVLSRDVVELTGGRPECVQWLGGRHR